jgi:hypothetical protein
MGAVYVVAKSNNFPFILLYRQISLKIFNKLKKNNIN